MALHPGTAELIDAYLLAAGHGEDKQGALFRALSNNRRAHASATNTPDGACKLLLHYAVPLKLDIAGFGRTRCVRQPPPMRWSTMRISPKSRNGWSMPTSALHASAIGGKAGRRTVRLSRSSIDPKLRALRENVMPD